jgi:cytochrome c oxidase assembly protein subunit 11
MNRTANPNARRRDIIVATSCGVFVAGMVSLAYASVPFYDWFCRVTGFGGRPQVATSAPQGTVGRTVTVRFDGNVGAGLPWRFEPEQNSIEVKLGEVVTVNFAGGVQRRAWHDRQLLPEDQLLLLHRTAPQAG